MEFRLINHLVGRLSVEKFKDDDVVVVHTVEKKDDAPATNVIKEVSALIIILIVAEILIYIILGITAVYFSWKSNSAIGWHPVMKVIFAFFAFMFSATYLFSHIMFKIDILSFVRTLQAALPFGQTSRTALTNLNPITIPASSLSQSPQPPTNIIQGPRYNNSRR